MKEKIRNWSLREFDQLDNLNTNREQEDQRVDRGKRESFRWVDSLRNRVNEENWGHLLQRVWSLWENSLQNEWSQEKRAEQAQEESFQKIDFG
jgi:hypothetical protein